MNIKIIILAMLVFVSVIPCVYADGLPWDKNTISLHHFDMINVDQGNGRTNTTIDQANNAWFAYTYYGDNLLVNSSTNCKFGECIFFNNTEASFRDGNSYQYSTGSYPSIPTDFMFGKNGNWTVEGWINLKSSPYTGTNATLVSWLGFGPGSPNTLNGTQIYVNSNWQIVLRTPSSVTGTPYLTTSSAITPNTWTSWAVTKNGTSMKIYLNGMANASASTATTYNWSPGYGSPYPGYSYVNPSIGYNEEFYLYENGINAVFDEIRISNVSRYPVNYTVASTEFFNPLNRTAEFFTPESRPWYNVGEVVKVFAGVSNVSYTDSVWLTSGCDITPYTPSCSVVSTSLNSSLPTGWNPGTVGNFGGSASAEFYTAGSPPVNSKTPVLDIGISLDDTSTEMKYGTTETGYVNYGSYNLNQKGSKYTIYNETYYVSGSDYTKTSYLTASPEIIDLSNLSYSVIDRTDIDPITYDYDIVNVGEPIKITMVAFDIYNVTGVITNYNYNTSMYTLGSITAGDPKYEITSTSGNGNISVTALYKHYGGSTNTPPLAGCGITSPVICGSEVFYNVTLYPTYAAYQQYTIGDPYGALEITPLVAPIHGSEIYYTAGNPFLNSAGYTYASQFYLDGAYSGSGEISDNMLVTTYEFININTGQKITGAATATFDNRDVSPSSPQNVVGGSLVLNHKGGTSNMTVAADGFFTTTQTFTIGTTGTTQQILLTPLSGPSATTWYSPHQVAIQVLDANHIPIPNTPISAHAIESTLPGGLSGALLTLQNAYGIPASEAQLMLDSSTIYSGNTDSYGYTVILMLSTIQYNVTAIDATGIPYSINIMPSGTHYQMLTPNATTQSIFREAVVENQALANSVYIANFTEPDPGNGTMWNYVYDSTGITTGANCSYLAVDNGTVWWENRTWAAGSGLQTFNKTVQHVPYQRWKWGCFTRP